MEDFSALAHTLAAGVGDARGSLILSRDGLVLGAFPPEAEGHVKPAWVRFAALGETERGFLQFGTEIWSYVRRGAYAAFVVTGPAVRPGLVIDQIEQVLLAAEGARVRRDAPQATEPPSPAPTPLSKPRTALHPEPRSADQPVVVAADAVRLEPVAESPPASPTFEAEAAEEAPDPAPEPAPEPARPPSSVWATEPRDDEEEVDRFSIAREFSQLLQDDPNAADG